MGGTKENYVLLYEQKEVDTTLSVHQSINKNLIFLHIHVRICSIYLSIYLFIFTCGTLTPPSHPSRSSGALQAEPGPHRRRGEEAVHVAETQRQRGASLVSLQRPWSAAAHRQRGDLGVQQGMSAKESGGHWEAEQRPRSGRRSESTLT